MIKWKLWSKHDFNQVSCICNLWSTNCLQSLGTFPQGSNRTTERSLKPEGWLPSWILQFTGCKMGPPRVAAGVKWHNGHISTYRCKYHCFILAFRLLNSALPKQSLNLVRNKTNLKNKVYKSNDPSEIQGLSLFPPTPSPECFFLSKEFINCIWIRNSKVLEYVKKRLGSDFSPRPTAFDFVWWAHFRNRDLILVPSPTTMWPCHCLPFNIYKWRQVLYLLNQC